MDRADIKTMVLKRESTAMQMKNKFSVVETNGNMGEMQVLTNNLWELLVL